MSTTKKQEQASYLHCCSYSSGPRDSISDDTTLLPTEKKKTRWVLLSFVCSTSSSWILLMLVPFFTYKGSMNNSVKPQNETMRYGPTNNGSRHNSSLRLENRRFTYNELEKITNKFQRVLGQGGFGKVYDGFLEDGTEVAVKVRTESSNQGDKEFLVEVEFFKLHFFLLCKNFYQEKSPWGHH